MRPTRGTLSWSASSGTVTGYRVYEPAAVKATATGTGATISGLTAGSEHTYTVKAYNGAGESAASGPVTATTSGCTEPPPASRRAAPYLYLGWGDPPSPSTVMNATGIRWFTMAFILSSGGCNPGWDGQRPLKGGVDEQAIAQELTSTATWTRIRDWARSKGLARLAFWSVNRDRPCPGGGVAGNCGGVDQQPGEFTKITAGFRPVRRRPASRLGARAAPVSGRARGADAQLDLPHLLT